MEPERAQGLRRLLDVSDDVPVISVVRLEGTADRVTDEQISCLKIILNEE